MKINPNPMSQTLNNMKPLKVLNLYAGIGGNRKLWENVEVTAVEYDPKIAAIYKYFFPNDTVIVGDAHQYLLDHYKEYSNGFIWGSPPCPTHSKMCMINDAMGRKVNYPDMKLYQEIILLQHFFDGMYVIENVMGYYKPLITPQECGRHFFWANFKINNEKIKSYPIMGGGFKNVRLEKSGLSDYNFEGFTEEKRDKVIKNMVVPEIGLSILNAARGIIVEKSVKTGELFAV